MTLDHYLRLHYRATTAKFYAFEIEHYLERIGGERAALRTNYTDLVGQLERLRQRYDNPATVNRILYAIKSYYRYLVASGKRSDYPGEQLKLRDDKWGVIQVQDLLSKEELQTILEPRAERYQGLKIRNQIVLGLLVYQAMLVKEIVALRTSDIDLEKGLVNIDATHRTNHRTLQLAVEQIVPLYNYLQTIRPKLAKAKTEQLILTSRGTEERGEGIHYLIETLRSRIPNKKLTPTSIRQSVIAQKLQSGLDLRKVQAFAGHRKVSSTERYQQTNLEELRRAVADFHPLNEKGNHFNH